MLRAGDDDDEEEEERCSRYDIVTSIRCIDRNAGHAWCSVQIKGYMHCEGDEHESLASI